MGRSVSTPHNCEVVCYRDVSHMTDEWDWDFFKEWIVEDCKSKWKSLYESDEWLGREDKVLLENEHCYIGVSEYCGLAAIWLKSKGEDYEDSYYPEEASLANLANHFTKVIGPGFEKMFSEFKKIGTFSNGESVYEKAA